MNTKDPASCRKVVEDFVQVSSGIHPLAPMMLRAGDHACLQIAMCV